MGTHFYPDESYIFAFDCIKKMESKDMAHMNALDNYYKSKLSAAVAQQTKFEP